jgi:hypothetical protein
MGTLLSVSCPCRSLHLPHPSRLASIPFNLATGTYLHRYPLALVLMLSGPSPGQRSAVPVLGTAFRDSVFSKNFLVASTWPLFTKSLMECSATRSSYIIVPSLRLSTPPDFHLHFFNLHARKFLGVMCRTTLSKPRLTWHPGANTMPRLLFGTPIHLQSTHNNAAHVDDTRSYRT